MPEDDSFRLIMEHPEHDAPRLACADHLEQRGDSDRAAFIRLQCTLARLAEHDARRLELERTEIELLARYRDEWLGPLSHLVEDERLWPGCKFRRGFVQEARLPAATFIRHGDRVFANHPVQKATLLRAGAEMGNLAACRHLSHLTELDLAFWDDDDPFREADFRTLLSSPYLEGLRGLGLIGANIGLESIKLLAQSELLSRLRRLHINCAHLDHQCVEALTASPRLQGLTDLDVSNNSIKLHGVRAVASCPYVAGLRKLSMGFNYVGEGCGEALAASPCLNQLAELYLSESNLGDVGLCALAASPCLAHLRTLYLDDNDISAEGVRALAQSRRLAGLRELVLFDNAIRDDGVCWLARSRVLNNLEHLCLGNCQISDVGVKTVAGSSTFRRLARLGLWSTGGQIANTLSDDSALALATSPRLSRLTWVNIGGNAFTSRGEQVLRERFGRGLRL
jgi:uncharacterized protein (TIGR02996 family)